jgi:hypothetical protein
VADIIEDPLWDLMLSTHTCTPGCGCDGDFVIGPETTSYWIDELGEEFGRFALRQVDELLTKGPGIEQEVAAQRCKGFRPPETVTSWLLRWRSAIEDGLRASAAAEVLPLDEARAADEAARRDEFEARQRWNDREWIALEAAGQDPRWRAAHEVVKLELRKQFRRGDYEAKAESLYKVEVAAQIMRPIEEACRARDPEHRAAAQRLEAAQLARLEAERRLMRAVTAAAASASSPQPKPAQ